MSKLRLNSSGNVVTGKSQLTALKCRRFIRGLCAAHESQNRFYSGSITFDQITNNESRTGDDIELTFDRLG